MINRRIEGIEVSVPFVGIKWLQLGRSYRLAEIRRMKMSDLNACFNFTARVAKGAQGFRPRSAEFKSLPRASYELSEFCDACSDKHKKEMDALTETLRVILEGRGE